MCFVEKMPHPYIFNDYNHTLKATICNDIKFVNMSFILI